MPVRLLVAALLCLGVSQSGASVVSIGEASEEAVVRILRVNGTVTSPQAAMLSTSVGGLIERYEVDAGDRVSTGDLLVQLDAELAALALRQARAAETEAKAALEDARRRLAEAEKVGSQRGIPETEIRSRRAEAAMDEAALAAAEAAVAERAAIVRRHAISAPFAGVVSIRLAEAGEWVNPGDELLGLVATEGLRFDFQVPQEHFPDIRLEMPIGLSVDAYPGARYEGRIRSIVPVSDPNARTFLLRATADDPDLGPVTPGMSARAAIHVDAGRSAVTVPRDALIRYPDGRTTVWVVEPEGDGQVARERRVKTGLEFDGRVEIRSGLSVGTRIVTRGNEVLRDGQTVTVR